MLRQLRSTDLVRGASFGSRLQHVSEAIEPKQRHHRLEFETCQRSVQYTMKSSNMALRPAMEFYRSLRSMNSYLRWSGSITRVQCGSAAASSPFGTFSMYPPRCKVSHARRSFANWLYRSLVLSVSLFEESCSTRSPERIGRCRGIKMSRLRFRRESRSMDSDHGQLRQTCSTFSPRRRCLKTCFRFGFTSMRAAKRTAPCGLSQVPISSAGFQKMRFHQFVTTFQNKCVL